MLLLMREAGHGVGGQILWRWVGKRVRWVAKWGLGDTPVGDGGISAK